jgi:3-oxoacyl-[acyl-carrier protein] reductase
VKNILITGINGSLGRELKSALLENEYSVYGISLSEATDICLDLNNIQSISVVRNIIKDKNITHLINNAGIYQGADFTTLSDEEIQKMININMVAPILLSKYLYQHLTAINSEGMIININSIAAKQPNFCESIYAATKCGLGGFGTALSTNQKKSKISVIDCYLGAFKSKITNGRDNFENLIDAEEVAKSITNLINTGNRGVITSFEYRSKL